MVDIITNSSTELFCVVKAKSQEEIQNVINQILEDCECTILIDGDFPLSVEPHEDWDNNDGEIIEGQYDIICERGIEPCGMIKKRIKEVFEIIEED